MTCPVKSRRWWPNVNPILGQCLVSTVLVEVIYFVLGDYPKTLVQFCINITTTVGRSVVWIQMYMYTIDQVQQARDIDPMLIQWLASVADGGPTIKQQWVDVPCLLGEDVDPCDASLLFCQRLYIIGSTSRKHCGCRSFIVC